MSGYFPKQGDIISLDFDPQAGHEQCGRRPALVVSGNKYIRHARLAIVCPITRTDRHYPTHLLLSDCENLTGFIMVEQIRSVDFTARKAAFIEKCPPQILANALSIIEACFE